LKDLKLFSLELKSGKSSKCNILPPSCLSSHYDNKSYKYSGILNKVIVKVAYLDSGKGTYKFKKGSKVVDFLLHFTHISSDIN